jgi:hypothetical protein
MDQMLSRAEGQRVAFVHEWRSVDVHQPSASSLRMMASALLLMSLALGVLALTAIAALPLLMLGAVAWTARPWLRRRSPSGDGRCRRVGFGLRGPAVVPSGRRVRPPLAHDAGRSGGTAYDRHVVG